MRCNHSSHDAFLFTTKKVRVCNAKTGVRHLEGIDSNEGHWIAYSEGVGFTSRIRAVGRSIFLVFSPPLPIQLVDDLLSTSQYLQSPAFVVVVARFWYEEIRDRCSGKHESAHDLQDVAEVLALPVILFALVVILKGIRQEDLDNPRSELAGCSCNAVTCASVTRWKDFRWYLRNVSLAERPGSTGAYDEGGNVGSKIERDVAENVKYDQAGSTGVQELCPRASCNKEQSAKDEETPELNNFGRGVLDHLYHQKATNRGANRYHDECVQAVIPQRAEDVRTIVLGILPDVAHDLWRRQTESIEREVQHQP